MKRTELLQNLLTAVLVLCALVVTGLLVRRELFPAAASDQGPRERVVRDWQSYAVPRHRAGPAGAPVTIVEFSDFQCPFCKTVAGRLDSLRARFPEDVAVVYRHFPLRIHPHAVSSARASECAAEQGRFWQMHDALFARQDSIGQLSWSRFASAAGVPDPASFQRCIERQEFTGLHEDTLAGKRLAIEATPTLLINRYQLVGAPPLDALEEYVRRALKDGDRAN